MSINDYLNRNISLLESDIISQLDNEFNSHDFIMKFAKQFEKDYILFLYAYKGNEAFRNVHSQIARFLSENSALLGICKTHKVKSQNVFGEIDEIQAWKKK
ncbi:MAG TPA: hypothetical protein DCQ31_19065 [Bacteroidales bacterium]|nr:hypothetical protein [Bacteroidales bacterium]